MAREQCGHAETTTVSFRGKQLQLCRSCKNRHDTQDLLGNITLEVVTLTQQRKYKEAYEILDRILVENRHLDKDGWLEWSILSQQADILMQQARLSDALEKYRLLSTMRFPNLSEFLLNQVSLFDTLDGPGDKEEARIELERGLDAATGVGIRQLSWPWPDMNEQLREIRRRFQAASARY